MKFHTLIETTAGVLEVETKTVPWIWTLLTFGIFRKAECKISGSALKRYHQIKVASSNRVNAHPPSPANQEWAKETKVFRTVYCRVAFWHKSMVEYVQAQGRVISDHHRFIQWHAALNEAMQDNDVERFQKLLEEEKAQSEYELEQWRKRKQF